MQRDTCSPFVSFQIGHDQDCSFLSACFFNAIILLAPQNRFPMLFDVFIASKAIQCDFHALPTSSRVNDCFAKLFDAKQCHSYFKTALRRYSTGATYCHYHFKFAIWCPATIYLSAAIFPLYAKFHCFVPQFFSDCFVALHPSIRTL